MRLGNLALLPCDKNNKSYYIHDNISIDDTPAIEVLAITFVDNDWQIHLANGTTISAVESKEHVSVVST